MGCIMYQFHKFVSISLICGMMIAGGCSVESKESKNTQIVSTQAETSKTMTEAELHETLSEISSFAYSYIECKEVKGDKQNSENCVTTERTNSDGKIYQVKWYKINSGEITAYSQFEETLNRLFTKRMFESLSDRIDACYMNKDDNIYISENAGLDGGVMGLDSVEIVSFEENGTSITVHFKAQGDKEYWELEQDNIIAFDIELCFEDGEWKLDKCGLSELLYLAWLYR